MLADFLRNEMGDACAAMAKPGIDPQERGMLSARMVKLNELMELVNRNERMSAIGSNCEACGYRWPLLYGKGRYENFCPNCGKRVK